MDGCSPVKHLQLRLMFRLLSAFLLFIGLVWGDTKTVAISYFDNTSGLEEYNSLSKGLADMLITDLSNVESIQIVEREKLESLLNEIKLGEIKFFDPATAQKLGKGLGADIILTGAFLSIEPDMRIDARLIDVATGKIIKANKVLGKSSDFFMLESQLVDQLIANLNIKLKKKRTQIKQEIKLNAVVDYSRSINLSDNGFDEEARTILENTVEENPDFTYASDRFSKLKQRIEILDREHENRLQENIRNLKENLDPDSDTFTSEINNLWLQLMTSMSYSKMLLVNEYLDSFKIESDLRLYGDASPITYGEMHQYYNILAYYSLKNHDQVLESGEKYLVEYPSSMYYTPAKTHMDISIKELEARQKGKQEAFEEIKRAEISFFVDIIDRYIRMDNDLSVNDYQQAKTLYNKWVMQIPIENLKEVVYFNDRNRWRYTFGVPSFLKLSKTFEDYEFLAQIIEIHRQLLLGTDIEETFYNLEDQYFTILDKKEISDLYYTDVKKRISFLINPKADKKKKWSAKLDSLKNAGFDSLVIIAGEKYLEINREEGNRDLYIERYYLWVKILSAAERRNNFLLWKELLDKYSNDLLLSEYNSQKHKKGIRALNKKYRGALKKYDDKWKDFNEKKSKKVLLIDYADIYRTHHQYADEILTRQEILSKHDVTDEEADKEYYFIFLAYINLGYFNEAETVLNIIENNYANSRHGKNIDTYRRQIIH